MALGLQHPHRPAEQRHGFRRKRGEDRVEIETAAFVAGMDDEAIAEQGGEPIQIGRIAARAHGKMQREIGAAAAERLRGADDRRDADAARDQAVMAAAPVELDQRDRLRDGEPRARLK